MNFPTFQKQVKSLNLILLFAE